MLTYLFRRLAMMVIIMILVSIIVFSLVNILPGDPAMLILGQEATEESLHALREEMGLNAPLYIQYLEWLGNILHGDFGRSMSDNSDVLTVLLQKIPITLQLSVMSFIIAIVIAIPVGVISATRKGTIWDYTSTTFALSGVSLPPFWLGILLIYVFSIKLEWLPPSGYVPITEDFGKAILLMILPAVTVGIRLSAELTRMLRSSLLEVLKADYIRTGYSKGLLEKGVIFRHALQNALIPLVTISGLQLGALLGGMVITESIFSIPGIGQLLLNSILTRDFPMVQGAVMFMAFSVIIVNFIVDIAYSILDPRIKLSGVTK